MAYLTINRLWHNVPVPLLRVCLSRPRAEARLAWVRGTAVAKPNGNHGDIAFVLLAHDRNTSLGQPVYVTAKDARSLLEDQFDATPAMLDRLLADSFAQRRYDALQRRHAE